MKRRWFAALLTLVLLASLLPALPVRAADALDYEVIYSTFNEEDMQNDPPMRSYISPPEEVHLRAITTCHWNDGKGKAPGTISLYEDDVLVGTWQAVGRSGGGAENALWDVFVDVLMEPGRDYRVEDSDPATWAWNEASRQRGFYALRGWYTSEGDPFPDAPAYRCSDWAKPELEKAAAAGLLPDVLKAADLTQNITRAEFAAVSVLVYEAMTETTVAPAAVNPFTDTRDGEVLKAYAVGITAGTSDTAFSPDSPLLREQGATMLTRAYKKAAFPDWTLKTDAAFPLSFTDPGTFADDGSISGYAKNSVYFMNASGIINGTGNNNFSPKSNMSREQAVIIAVRMLEKLKVVGQPQPTQPPSGGGEAVLTGQTAFDGGIMGPAQGTLSYRDVTVDFGTGYGGDAVLMDDRGIVEHDDPNFDVYALGLTDMPDKTLTVSYAAPAPAAGTTYMLQLGIPVEDETGTLGTLWADVPAEYAGGRATAQINLSYLEAGVQELRFDDGEGRLRWAARRLFWALPDAVNTFVKREDVGIKVVRMALGNVVTYDSEHFWLCVPTALDYPEDSARELLKDMEGILRDYDREYAITRTEWPMTVNVGTMVRPMEGGDAFFAMPLLSAGGVIGSREGNINASYMKIDKEILGINSTYKVNGKWTEGSAFLYGTLAHELFHFVQRCYCTGVGKLWFDESSAAYYDMLYSEKAGYKTLDQNYETNWVMQYDPLQATLKAPKAHGEYASLPFFEYLMKQDPHALRKCYETLGKLSVFTSWPTVLQTALSPTLTDLFCGYFKAMVADGELSAVNARPWEIAEDLIYNGGSRFGAVGDVIRLDDLTPGKETAVSFTIPAYGVHFLAVDVGKNAGPEDRFSFRCPGEGLTVYDMQIDSCTYAKGGPGVFAEEIRGGEGKDYWHTGVTFGSTRYFLLMVVNTTNKAYTGGLFGGSAELQVRLKDLTSFDFTEDFWLDYRYPKEQKELFPLYWYGSYQTWDSQGIVSSYSVDPVNPPVVAELKFQDAGSLTVKFWNEDGVVFESGPMKYDQESGLARGKNCVVQVHCVPRYYDGSWYQNASPNFWCRVFDDAGRPTMFFVANRDKDYGGAKGYELAKSPGLAE